MSTERRRQELREEQRQRDIQREAEEARRAGLTLYQKIEECEDIHEIKEVLHELAEQLNLS
jgi:hypothetical protein